MGRIVKADTGFQTVSVVQDLLELKLGTGQAAVVHRILIMQSSDETTDQAELLQINVKRATGTFTSGSGGGAATIVKGMSGDAAHGLATIERNNTTQAVAGSGTLETIDPGCFSVLQGEWERTLTPELRYPLGPSEALILSLDEAPADALTLRAFVDLEIILG